MHLKNTKENDAMTGHNEDRNFLLSQSTQSSAHQSTTTDDFKFSGANFQITQELPPPPRLSLPLRILFAMNGVTLALPTTALMFILNTRVSMSLTLIPTYAAIAFLPYSLKPLYAFLSSAWAPRHRRHMVITWLLVASGISTAGTALTPVGGVWACIICAFVRGVTSAWPEFLLGLTLIDQARQEQPAYIYGETAALFQAQAATARNLGALAAHAAATGFFALRHFVSNSNDAAPVQELNDSSVTLLLVAAGILNCIAALVAWVYRIGSTTTTTTTPAMTTTANAESPLASLTSLPRRPSYDSCSDASDTVDCESLLTSCGGSGPTDATHRNIRLVVLLQLVIVLFSLRGPIEEVVSDTCWNLMAAGSIFALAVTGCTSPSLRWERSHRVGLFLILRHALPSASNIMASYFYSLFSSMPAFLQLVSLTDMFVTTLASWTYGRVFSRYSKDQQLHAVIAGTTVFAAVASLANLLLVKYCTPDSKWAVQVFIAVGVKTVTTWTGEWNFLPDVILATVSAVPENNNQERSAAVSLSTPTSTTPSATIQFPSSVMQQIPSSEAAALTCTDSSTTATTTATPTDQQLARGDDSQKVDIQYGTLISCIDFGDQLGALLAGPLVAILGISRENDWAGMDTLIQLSALAALLSIGFIAILR
jgi:hypothetical protein